MDDESTFCSLCGVLVEPHDGTPVDEDEHLPWISEVRAIRTEGSYCNPLVTGVGYLNFHREICADLRTNVRYNHPGVDLEAHELGRGPRQYWCFPVHETCFKLLQHRVNLENREAEIARIARHLFAIFYTTPTNGARVLLPGHDYGSAAQCQCHSAPELSQRYHHDNYYLQHDPNDDFDFSLALGQEGVELPTDDRDLRINDADETGDVFRDLPSEIIMLILSHLPSGSVCNLRLSSRSVAAASQPSQLPQSFWSTRFFGQNEMSFVFAGRFSSLPPEPVNWRRLYVTAKSMLTDPRTYPALRNRFRIWHSLDEVLPALKIRLHNEGEVTATPYNDNTINPRGHMSPIASGDLAYEDSLSALRDHGASTELDAGCRLFEVQCLDWSKAITGENVALGVSLLHHGGRTYVSGIRLLSGEKLVDRVELTRAGFINTSTEQHVHLSLTDTLSAVLIRVIDQGIVAVCLKIQRDDVTHSYTFGDFDLEDPESGVVELCPNGELRATKFLLGLDVNHEDLKTSPNNLPYGEKEQSHIPQAEIWSPSLPSKRCAKWNYPEAFPPQTFNLCLHIDFGGSKGELLRSLCMVNVFMGEYPHVLFGFSFVYSDGSERLFGRKSYHVRAVNSYPCIMQSFSVAGDKGEAIQEIMTSYSRAKDVIQAISFRTNFGRSKLFRLYGSDTFQAKSTVTTMTAPSGQEAITGFFVKLKSPGGHIRDLVVDISKVVYPLYNQLLPEDKALLSASPPHLESAKEMLAYTGGFAFMTASLTGVRRIQLSIGVGGFSRSTDHISGLQLHYEDKDPVIVGQYIQEFTTLQFEPDERLVKITTWHGVLNRFSRVKFGPIIAMELTTSKGKSLICKRQKHLDDLVCLRYRENPHERIDTIIWGYNYIWDHVRFLYVPKADRNPKRLILGPNTREIPPWAVAERIFVLEEDADGSPDPMTSIEVTYKPMSDEPSSISFLYKSGKVQAIGIRGERSNSQDLEEGEKLTRLIIGTLRGKRLGSISFHTDKSRIITFIEDKNQELRTANATQRLEVLELRPGIDTELEDLKLTTVHTPNSSGTFVGLWAIPTRRDGTLTYPMFGPIFGNDLIDGS